MTVGGFTALNRVSGTPTEEYQPITAIVLFHSGQPEFYIGYLSKVKVEHITRT